MTAASRAPRGPLPRVRISAGTAVTVVIVAVLVYPQLISGPLPAPAPALALSLGIAVALIASVVVHELAHAFAATLLGGRVEEIALTLWGGHTQYTGGQLGPWRSLVISLAGPASNALLAWGLDAAGATMHGTLTGLVLSYLAILNGALALFNLLPGLPMDGGRAVESLIEALGGRPMTATAVTAWIGRAIAVAIIVVPVIRLVRDPGSLDIVLLLWALIIGQTLWRGATDALRASRQKERIGELDPAALSRPMLLMPGDASLVDVPASVPPAAVLVVDHALMGWVLDPNAVDGAVRAGAAPPLGALTVRIGPVIAADPEARPLAIIEAMQEAEAAAAVLIGREQPEPQPGPPIGGPPRRRTREYPATLSPEAARAELERRRRTWIPVVGVADVADALRSG